MRSVKSSFRGLVKKTDKSSSNNALTSNEWGKVVYKKLSYKKIADGIRNKNYPDWCLPLLNHTSVGDSTLELGCGTGKLSAILGVEGRITHLLDYTSESINFGKALFQELGLQGHFYKEDILNDISLEKDSIDWVWSSGLLEHFSDEQIIYILKQSLRICKKGVMCLVPNANSLIYRIGKFKQERDGTWKYGLESPKYTLKNYFQEVGLRNIIEYSISPLYSIIFFDRIRKEAELFFKSLDDSELNTLNQGYLLFTYGTV